MSKIEVSVFNVLDVSKDHDQRDLMFDVALEEDGEFGYGFTVIARGADMYYAGPYSGEIGYSAMYKLIMDRIDELSVIQQAELLLRVVDIHSDHLVRGAKHSKARGVFRGPNNDLRVVLRSKCSAKEQAEMAPGAYCLMDDEGNCVPFDTAEEYVDFIACVDQDGIEVMEALAQAATIRHALGEQSAACPSATRKI